MKTPSPSVLSDFSLTEMTCPWSGFAWFLVMIIVSAVLALRPLSACCQGYVTSCGSEKDEKASVMKKIN